MSTVRFCAEATIKAMQTTLSFLNLKVNGMFLLLNQYPEYNKTQRLSAEFYRLIYQIMLFAESVACQGDFFPAFVFYFINYLRFRFSTFVNTVGNTT